MLSADSAECISQRVMHWSDELDQRCTAEADSDVDKAVRQ